MKKLFIFIILALLSEVLQAQITVTGVVTDVTGSPLSAAIVKNIDASTKKMLAFCNTDSKGKFSIKARLGSLLQISAMSYKKLQIVVKADMPEQHFVLEDDAKALDEITVKAKPVRIDGDTIKYLLGVYAKPGDRTLADVLARVPGFEVNKSTGQISYEGRSISNFYIEGMDMLGGKYGVASKSLPQNDIATVEVMKHHTPIRVLDDFVYSDESAINVRMKKGAKAHWIATFNGGIGYKSGGGLWNFESFAMRLKQNWQTMITYKTNNSGRDIIHEMNKAFTYGELESRLSPFILLPSPASSRLGERSLFNKSHTLNLNMLQRMNETSQISFQVSYINDHKEASSKRTAEYFSKIGSKVSDNEKHYVAKTNELFVKVKYENNANSQYLKNELSTNLNWNKQLLIERGTNPHEMNGNLPVFTLKDNLLLMRKYGKRLYSFESKNIMEVRPQQLAMDTLRQDINQHYYETDNKISGSFRLGKLVLTGKVGANAVLHVFSSHLVGIPDSIGMLSGNSRFSMVRLYVNSNIEYKLSDFIFNFSSDVSYNRYKYSLSTAYNRAFFSPNLHIRWNATPHWTFAVDGRMGQKEVDVNQFYPTLVLADYEYINKGFADYRIGRDKTAGIIVRYNNALQGTSVFLTANRTFMTTPYTASQDYVGSYIVLSLVPQETKNNAWTINLMGSQGAGFLKGKLNVRAIYNSSKSYIVQNNEVMPFNTNTFNIRVGLTVGLVRNTDLGYNLEYSYYQSDMPTLSSTYTLNNWKHNAYLRLFLTKKITTEARTEYYHNQIAKDKFKDIFFADLAMRYSFKKFDITLELNNLLNRKNYGYGVNGTFVHSYNHLNIRGRELMVSIYYKP
jgi:hypothetical protein